MEKETRTDSRGILDIHTHNPNKQHAIINYRLRPFASLQLLPSKKVGKKRLPTFVRGLLLVVSSIYNLLIVNSAPLHKKNYYSVGVHPWELEFEYMMIELKLFRRLSVCSQVVAIGEAGLDKLSSASMNTQTSLFELQVKYSEALKKPLIIHCVKAMEELLAVKREMHPLQPWVWHGFRGKPEQAKQLLDQGFYLSFGENYQEQTMAMVPADRLFLETDESDVDIENLLLKAAKIRGVEPEVLRETIRENVQKVFFKG